MKRGIEALQFIFDFSVNHIRTQGKPAVGTVPGPGHARCRYRTNDPVPLMCAAGCMILDSAYHSDLEGRPIDAMSVKAALQPWLQQNEVEVSSSVWTLMARLQITHDNHFAFGKTKEHWESQVCEIAEADRLVYTPPTEATCLQQKT